MRYSRRHSHSNQESCYSRQLESRGQSELIRPTRIVCQLLKVVGKTEHANPRASFAYLLGVEILFSPRDSRATFAQPILKSVSGQPLIQSTQGQ